ncbi:MAG: endonuclease MutS2 [Eubacteriales bacterium]|nr:endonuclease MutS2 [Eubacteriales bacterium]
MEEKSLKTLEFYKIIDRLCGFATSDAGRALCAKIKPDTNLKRIREWQKNTTDAAERIHLKGSAPSFRGVKEIGDTLRRLEVGAALSIPELLSVSAVLSVAARAKAFDRSGGEGANDSQEERLDSLSDYFAVLEPLTPVNNELKRCIISEDELADDASDGLFRVRRKQKQISNQIHGSITGLLNTYRDYLTDAVVTQRDGRYCLPVKAEYKSRVPGMVHDSSSTGLTLFIEPMAIVKLNNDLRELFQEEQKEIEAVLLDLSLQLSVHAADIRENIKYLRKLDMIFAKALFSAELFASEPVFSEDRRIDIKSARHPLIPKDHVVPIDLRLGAEFDLLVITGPNTGGKTVSLKTAGLLQLMGQAGLHIPANEGSVLGVFDEIYADIGDEQSIEQSLSTFSAHMTNIVHILDKADAHSLCLFDELGAGTDPTEGAALATAILHFLHNMKTRTIATTHYSELKVYALQTEGVENASCEFDVETLRPTYRLLIGIPGKSNAFAISKKLGLPDYIIDEAKKRLESEDERFEDLIRKLNDDRVQAERARTEIESYKLEIEQLRTRIRQKETKLDENRDKILREAKSEATRILKDAKDTADSAIRNLNQLAQKGGAGDLHAAAETQRERLRAGLKKNEGGAALKIKGPAQPVSAKKIKIGDGVRVMTMGGMKGTVSTLPDKDGNIFVQLGIMKSKVNVRDIELLNEASVSGPGYVEKRGRGRSTGAGAAGARAGSGVRTSFSPKAFSVSPEVNLIGMTTDEAIPVMEKYLDDAYLAHLEQVRVVHGRGTGALKKAVHAQLKRLKYVKDFRLGEFGEGDTGVTIVTFK